MGHSASKKRTSSHSPVTENSAGGASDIAKKQKTDFDGVVQHEKEEEEDITRVAVSPVADPASSSTQVKSEEEEPKSGDEKTILQVLTNIDENPTRVDAVEASFGLLKQLVRLNKDEDLMKCIIDADGISVVVAIMKSNVDHEGLQKEGLALLELLCKAVEQKPEKKGIEAVILVMKILPGIIVLQTKCCQILMKAAEDCGFRQFIGEAGGIPLIVSVLKDHQDKEDVLEHGLGALMKLAYLCHPNKKIIVDSGGISVVIDTLMRHKENAKLVYGLAILANLARHKENATHIIEANGYVAVVTFVNNHLQNCYLQQTGCWALASLVRENTGGYAKKIVDAGAVPAVVKAMELHANDVNLQRGACNFLKNLGENGSILAAMKEAGALVALATAIDNHPSNNDVLMWAKEAWERLVHSLTTSS